MALTNGLRSSRKPATRKRNEHAVRCLRLAPGSRLLLERAGGGHSFGGSPFAVERQFTIAPRIIDPLMLGNGQFQFSFTNQSSASYEVLWHDQRVPAGGPVECARPSGFVGRRSLQFN